MKTVKRLFVVLLSIVLLAGLFAGCAANEDNSLSDTTLIIGYTEEAAPFITAVKDGEAEGFIPALWEKIFDDVKGDLKAYRFEQVEEGYLLEDDGGFFDENGKEYSAGLLMGAVSKNEGTFNEDYSFTEPIITNRIIAVTTKDSGIKSWNDFAGARVVAVGEQAKAAFERNTAIASVCTALTDAKQVSAGLGVLDDGLADVLITDELSFNTYEGKDNYTVLENELDTIEYVIACAKYSGWKDSINTAIYELQSDQYNDADEFTPLVEEYFGYDASDFRYQP
ncbi:MAG: transporter substrate-binding domain-containing protein [Eubacterium sp.]|nr:transporter substrate-binding domain-containing protein [Eubacterium sp.]